MSADDKETLRLLGTHATVLANAEDSVGEILIKPREDDQKTPLGQLEMAFTNFIDVLEEERCPQGYLQDLKARETIVYWRFWEMHKLYQKSG